MFGLPQPGGVHGGNVLAVGKGRNVKKSERFHGNCSGNATPIPGPCDCHQKDCQGANCVRTNSSTLTDAKAILTAGAKTGLKTLRPLRVA